MVNTPIPHSLRSESKKAAKILKDFTIPNAKAGPDKIIPAGLITKAQGLAILTVAKIGFLVTARGGSGIVIAKLPGGAWSAPSAIGIAGLGGGFEIGLEVTDFVIILNSRSAVEAFSKGGNLTLGGNFTIAVGPLGRNAEADVSVRSPAAIYTYSKTKGLFAGISIEGSALIERKDANKKFYHESVRAVDILNGNVDPGNSCSELYDVLENHEEMFDQAVLALAKREARKGAERQVNKYSGDSATFGKIMSVKKTSTTTTSKSGSKGGDSSSMTRSRSMMITSTKSTTTVIKTARPRGSSFSCSSRGQSASSSHTQQSLALATPMHDVDSEWDVVPKARAVYAYNARMPCDLSFQPGDEIEILTRTSTQNDWWEGKVNGKTGIFPANYVDVM